MTKKDFVDKFAAKTEVSKKAAGEYVIKLLYKNYTAFSFLWPSTATRAAMPLPKSLLPSKVMRW